MFNPRVLDPWTRPEVEAELEKVAPHARGWEVLRGKALFLAVKLHGVGYREANIAKQEMLGSGGDVATGKGTADFTQEATDIVILGTQQQYRRFLARMRRQPFQCKALAAEVQEALGNYRRDDYRLELRGRTLDLATPRIMGILNVTPDSFSDGGRHDEPGAALARAQAMVAEGADVVDVGGESTRPGAEPVALEEEWRRVGPILKVLVDALPCPISIDTYKAEVARRALDLGVGMVNDVTGLGDPVMVKVVARHDVPAVVMHMRGDPRIMQVDPQYGDVVGEVLDFLRGRTAAAVAGGVGRERLVVDPGIGFGKTPDHNLQLLHHLAEFRSLGFPILVGVSRKGFLGHLTGEAVEGHLEASITAAALAYERGARILRVHDVAPTTRALRVAHALLKRHA